MSEAATLPDPLPETLSELYAEHDRLWTAFTATPREERRAALDAGYEGDSEAIRLWQALGVVNERIRPLERDLEAELQEAFAADLADEERARALYHSLCNVDWRHEDGSRYGCSWRYAGGLVADLRGQGEDYLDFYCSGNEGVVDDRVSETLAARGWHPYLGPAADASGTGTDGTAGADVPA